MLNNAQIRLIDTSYFTVLKINPFCISLQSRCTGHYWHIVLQEYSASRSFQLWHRHGDAGAYHLHGHAGSLETVLNDIKDHDTYQLSGRRRSDLTK